MQINYAANAYGSVILIIKELIKRNKECRHSKKNRLYLVYFLIQEQINYASDADLARQTF